MFVVVVVVVVAVVVVCCCYKLMHNSCYASIASEKMAVWCSRLALLQPYVKAGTHSFEEKSLAVKV
jgi:hypothetical protein